MWNREEAVKFFYERAGYAVPVGASDAEVVQRQQARAVALAEAERVLLSGPYFVEVVTDPAGFDGDSDWDGPVYIVSLHDVTDERTPTCIGSLGGVCAESEQDPYIRLVAAELMDEYLASRTV